MAEDTQGHQVDKTKFKCANCGGIFDKEVSDEEAMQESKNLFGDVPTERLAVVCDDCFIKLVPEGKRTPEAKQC